MIYIDGRELDVVKEYKLDELDKYSADYILYTLRHKKALIMTYMELEDKIPDYNSKLWYHDVDKLFMYYILGDTMKSHHIHVTYARHHYGNWECLDDRREAVLDYECARITKSDKPLNAYETVYKFRPEAYEELKGIMEGWGIDSADRKDYEFKLYEENKDYVEETLFLKTCESLHHMLNRHANGENYENIVKDYDYKISKLSI